MEGLRQVEGICECPKIKIAIDGDLKLVLPVTDKHECAVCGKILVIMNLGAFEPKNCACLLPVVNMFWFCQVCRGCVDKERSRIHAGRAIELRFQLEEAHENML